MGSVKGFLEWARRLPRKRPVDERLGDYDEFVGLLEPDEARRQAGRCMDCGIPFCHQGCPLGNLIPEWNDLVHRDRWRQAWVRLASTNDFPEFTGRLCPAPCEAACTLAINIEPVAIEQIEKEIAERAFEEGWVRPQPPATRSGFHVAVVGSGPGGLAAAAQLNRAGHTVTVHERDDRLGGLLRYGIPDFKMEKHIIDRRVAVMEAEGVRFRTGVDVGVSPTWSELRATHDAVVVAIGARRPRELPVPGRELHGVVQAMDYLEAQNRAVAGDGPVPVSAQGSRVVILGGGDTGADCLGTAHRQGAAHVTQVELMPAPPPERPPGNPWPQWPLVFTTGSSHEEGGERAFAVMTKHLQGEGGRLTRLHASRVALEGGRLVELPGQELTLDVDLLILAMGFVGPDATALSEQLGVALDDRGNVRTDDRFHTTADGVFCAGDARRGASLIVWAIAEGRETAREVDAWLTGRASALPTRGLDAAFGGR